MNRSGFNFQTAPEPSRVPRWLGLGLLLIIALPICVVLGFRANASLRETRTAAELAPKTGRFVATPSGRIFVQEAGPETGPPVLLVHGMAAWSELWRPTMTRLGQLGYRVIAIDLPPFGFSDRGAEGGNTRAALAGRLRDVLEAMSLSRVTIVAHSIGSAPVVETAMRHPERIGALVLVCGALGLVPEGAPAAGPSWLDWFLATPLLRDPVVASTLTNPLATKALFQRLVAKPEAIDAPTVAVLQTPMRLRDSTPAFGRWLRDLVAGDPGALSTGRANYGRVTVPTRLLWGDRDTITPLAQGHELERLIAGAKLTVLPGLGHVPQVEDAAGFQSALEATLREVGAAPESGSP